MNTSIDDAILAHHIWIARFQNALSGIDRATLNPVRIRKDTECAFGEWLHGNPDAFPSQESFENIKALHAAFHDAAADIAALIRQDDPPEESIKAQMSELRILSRQLIALLGEAKSCSDRQPKVGA